MSAISPIVGISKIIGQYSTIVVGFDGVIYDGKEFNLAAVKALAKAKELGKNVILFSNSDMTITQLVSLLQSSNIPVKIFSLIMTAGEIFFNLLRKNKRYASLGKKYFCLGSDKNVKILNGSGFENVSDINDANFVFVGGFRDENDRLGEYREIMQVASSLGLPMICVGNDVYAHINGEICEASGAFAEQYAMMGGKINTIGKPDLSILRYVLENYSINKEDFVVIGDNLQTDIKMANLYDADSVLITRGIHKEILGEGYIPDVQKAKELASDYGVYPKYLISELRW